MNIRKSKIVAKIADNKSEVPFLKMVIDAGVDVCWLNTAHQDEPEALELVKRIRSVSDKVAIMIDTKGPEIRTKNIEIPFEVKTGDKIVFTGDLSHKGKNVVQVSYPNFHNEVPVGSFVLYDDASIETVVTAKVAKGIECTVKGSGLIKNKKSLNIPGVHIALPALTDKDKGFVRFCAKNDIDYISHSFVRSKEDLFEIHDILKEFPSYKGKIISKIENREGFDNLKEILKYSEGIMVARGDLGAEVPMEELPYMQKKMVEQTVAAGRYCIVATQALDSMIRNPRPTRAEVTDIANAILEGSGSVSLSGETAYGDFPRESVEMMSRVMSYTEAQKSTLLHAKTAPAKLDANAKFAQSVLKKSEAGKANAVFVVGADIAVLRAFASFRPSVNVFAACSKKADVRELGMAYGIDAHFVAEPTAAHLAQILKGSFKPKDKVMVVEKAGKSFKTSLKAFSAIK